MKEQDLLEEIGKVSEELIAAYALPDAKQSGEGGAEKSVTAKEQIVMSEKKSEYIRNPLIRALPAIAAVAAVLVAGIIILPKVRPMKTPGASVISDDTAETNALDGFTLDVREAALKVNPDAELERSASLETEAELCYNGEAAPQTVWYSGFALEKNGKVLYQSLADSVQPENFNNSQADSEQDVNVTVDQEPDPIPVAFSAQGAIPFQILAHELDPHFIQNEAGDLMLTAYFRVGSPAAEPVTLTVPVTYQVVEITGVELPDITGWAFASARQALLSAGLMIDKRSAYDDEVPEGFVISSDPQGPATVSSGDYIRIIVSLGSNKDTVLVPNFINMDWELAKTMADGMGLVLIKNEVADGSKAGTVLKQNIIAGEEVSEGTAIELTVSNGETASDGEKTNATVRVIFDIPAEAAKGQFHIELLADGATVAVGSSFNPEHTAGVTSLVVNGAGEADMQAVLVKEDTMTSANIGTYHINFNEKTYEMISGDIGEAFRRLAE